MTPFLSFAFSHRDRRAGRKGFAWAALVLFLAGAWYAVAANSVVSVSYRYNDAVSAQERASREVEALRAKTAQAQSPEALETKAQGAGFSQILTPQYLSLPGTLVAQR